VHERVSETLSLEHVSVKGSGVSMEPVSVCVCVCVCLCMGVCVCVCVCCMMCPAAVAVAWLLHTYITLLSNYRKVRQKQSGFMGKLETGADRSISCVGVIGTASSATAKVMMPGMLHNIHLPLVFLPAQIAFAKCGTAT
jgi:hypothetical protein